MEIRYCLNADDYTDYNQYLMGEDNFKKRVKKQRVVSALMVLAVGIFCMFSFKDRLIEAAVIAVVGAAALFFAFPALAKGGMKSALMNMIKQDSDSLFREQLLRLDSSYLHVESEDKGELITKDSPTEELEGVSRSGNLFLIHFQNGNLLLVPTRAFNSQEEQESFIALCGGMKE